MEDTKNGIHLEAYEWDSMWIEQTSRTDAPRVLYIGDSISNVARGYATRESGNTVLFDGYGTSKAVDNPYFCETVKLFAKQQRERRLVIFNNGLHGPHLDDETEYREHYEKIIKFLLAEFENTPIALVLSTATAKPERNLRVEARNRAVCDFAEKYGLPIIDLYTVSKLHPEVISEDGIHFLPEGYSLLAKEINKRVREILNI